jgi:predicted cupin superfamily sugar epimerase
MAELSTAQDIIARLDLKPHPEGGHYRETFRDTRLEGSGGRDPPRSISFSREASARTGTASTRWRSGTITPATR